MYFKHFKFLESGSVIFRLTQSQIFSSVFLRFGVIVSVMILVMPSMTVSVQAQDSEANEDYEISIGTSVSQGFIYRLKERDLSLINSDPNGDDGNLNFDKGLVSAATKVTSEIDFRREDIGLFSRFTGYWDLETADGKLKRTELTSKARKIVGRGVKLLDFYGYKEFEYGDTFGDVRVGNVVLNWGESTFVQNGINVVNPVDVSRVRTPGSELREALVPVPLVAVSVAPTDNLSVETFWQLRWKKTEIDPAGTFFSNNDYVGEGGKFVEIDLRELNPLLIPNDMDDFLRVERGPDRKARNSGQFGMALRYLAEGLNDTEFGFFFTQYHSRRPIVSAITGPSQSVENGINAVSQGAHVAIDRYARGARYFIEYPEEIKLYGISFNTLLGNSGWALQGEISHHADAPLQREDSSIIAEGLRPINHTLVLLNSNHPDHQKLLGFYRLLAANQGLTANNAIELIKATLGTTGVPVVGYVRRDVSQVQLTGTKTFGSILGADSGVFLMEAAYTKVHKMPDAAIIPLDGPGGSVATDTSWGYRAVTKLDYFNAVGSVNLHPYVQFQHDVDGTTPPPMSNFVEGAKTLTLGVSADYLQEWGANLSYTRYFGAGWRNTIRDRDYLEFSINYSF